MSDNRANVFFEYYKQYNLIKKDITDIVLSYDGKIHFYKEDKNPVFELYDDYLFIKINTGYLPFDLIEEINQYMGMNCDRISGSNGHYMSMAYIFKQEGV